MYHDKKSCLVNKDKVVQAFFFVSVKVDNRSNIFSAATHSVGEGNMREWFARVFTRPSWNASRNSVFLLLPEWESSYKRVS